MHRLDLSKFGKTLLHIVFQFYFFINKIIINNELKTTQRHMRTGKMKMRVLHIQICMSISVFFLFKINQKKYCPLKYDNSGFLRYYFMWFIYEFIYCFYIHAEKHMF